VLWSTMLCKEYGKVCSKITMVEVQTLPLENNTMWQHFWPLHSVLSPSYGFIKKQNPCKAIFALYFNIILSSEIFSQFSQVLHLSHNSFTKYFTLTKFVKIISISIIHIVKRVSNMKTPIDFQKSLPPHDWWYIVGQARKWSM